jgi:hypothetical protein
MAFHRVHCGLLSVSPSSGSTGSIVVNMFVVSIECRALCGGLPPGNAVLGELGVLAVN